MRITAVLIGLFLLPTPAFAWNWCSESAAPPAEFAGEPTLPYKIARFPPEWVPEMCGSNNPYQVVGGCFEEVEGVFFITARDDVSETEVACIIWHEKAHVNGWEHGEYAKLTTAEAEDWAAGYSPIPGPYWTHGR